MLILFLVIILAAVFYYAMTRNYAYWKDRGIKQGNALWIIGDTGKSLFQLKCFADVLVDLYNRFPGTRYSGIYQLLTPTLVVTDPELLKKMAVKDFDHFADHRSVISEVADPFFGKNLLSLKGEKWHDMRSILSPSFTSSKMKAMFVLISQCAENFVEYFLHKGEETLSLEMKDVFTRFTNDAIATTAFGVEVDSLRERENRFYMTGKTVTDFTGFWRNMKFFGFLIFPKLYELLGVTLLAQDERDFFMDLINDTIKTREEKGIVRPDMIHLLMEARKGKQKQEENGELDAGFATAQESEPGNEKVRREITNEDIASQAMIFFLAGFDTASNLMCFLSYELAANIDIQDRLRKEVLDTLDECGGKLTYEGLARMKYMDMVVSETLRKWPVAVATDRVCTKPYIIEPVTPEEKPIYLEKGSLVIFPIFAVHRDPKYYPNPDKFDPERFSDENKREINPYTYFPFGLGPRNCIGSRFALLETKALFFHILSHFELVPVKKTRIPLELSKKSFNLSADGGFWAGMKRLN